MCEKCLSFSMVRTKGKWICPSCQFVSKNAHIQAIIDYLLINTTITNQQCRDFLVISSEHIAKHLLRSMKLSYVGKTNTRKYFLS